jgi:hypothetical protein
MSSIRSIALLLALGMPTLGALQAQSSSSNPAPADQAQQPAATSQGATSVQARIHARREARRAAAIRDTYGNLFEAYTGGGYMRFAPGTGYASQRVNEYNWNVGFTRYYTARTGVDLDIRGIYGQPFILPHTGNSNITKPEISQYSFLAGPVYRFKLEPRYAISGRVMAGAIKGRFSGDTSNDQTLSTSLGLWPDATTFAANASVLFDVNITPGVALRIAPDYTATNFGSNFQNNLGYTIGMVFRFKKR